MVDFKKQYNYFGGYDYETTLAYFIFTIRNPGDVRNGITRAEWFFRCHDVTRSEFAKVVRERESEAKFSAIMANKNRP